ncbi:hypothetical protein, partial [Neisseria sicca]
PWHRAGRDNVTLRQVLQYYEICKLTLSFALSYINFCTWCVLKVAAALALYRIAENKKSNIFGTLFSF